MPAGARPAPVDAGEAEAMAISILAWLTGRPDLLGRFMALSGVDGGSIRQAAREPGFLAGVTGFVMAHEPTLLAFCADSDIRAERVAACHRELAGPEGEWP